MGLLYGCTNTADTLFKNRHKLEYVHVRKKEEVFVLLNKTDVNCRPTISSVYGDCTACAVYLEYLNPEEIDKTFTMLQEYMSINARISCFFSIKKQHLTIQDWIKKLKKFPIAGLHVQKSNREPNSHYYMITGILKVPNPIVNTYNAWNTEYPKNHDNNNVTKINKLNKEFDLETF